MDPNVMVQWLDSELQELLWAYVAETAHSEEVADILRAVSQEHPDYLRVKELFETMEAYRRIGQEVYARRRERRVDSAYDLACGHGLLGILLAWRLRSVEVVCVDLERRVAFDHYLEGVRRAGVELSNVRFVEADITTAEQAEQCLEWYCLRWRLEDWHRVLKSGCQIDALGDETAERLQRGIAINAVIAWRIMLMTLLGRACPELPAGVLLSDLEIKVLQAYARKKNIKQPTHLGDAVRLVARLGGYLCRNHDPPPGHQLIWQGYTVLQTLCEGFSLKGDPDSS